MKTKSNCKCGSASALEQRGIALSTYCPTFRENCRVSHTSNWDTDMDCAQGEVGAGGH